MKRNRLLIVSIIIVFIVTMVPGDGNVAGNYLDKVVHFLVFLMLSINICYRFYENKRLIDSLIWAIFFGLMTEVIQQFIPGRNMDIYDAIADTLGVISGFYLYKKAHIKIDIILLKLSFSWRSGKTK
ncbi:MAG: VanZ family protein [Prolixibacteraceae bacterium]|jgi:VanZ family protein|nr:VanZ family protein [Prolixibacteraceae bacterium]